MLKVSLGDEQVSQSADIACIDPPATDPNLKPPELQTLIENFCLGTRRLHLFGSKNSLRRGWLTVSLLTDGGARTLFSKESKVQTIEKEDGIVWEPREWDKDEWAKTWEQDGEGSVAPLLPFNEGEPSVSSLHARSFPRRVPRGDRRNRLSSHASTSCIR